VIIPDFVRRAAWRVFVAGVVCAGLAAVGGMAGERIRFGADYLATRDRLAADAQRQFSTLGARLNHALAGVRDEPVLATAVNSRDASSVRDLFDRLAAIEESLGLPSDALAVYSAEGRPLAWAGRPGPLPTDRLSGPDALFLVPSAGGLRLTRVAAVTDGGASDRRVATVVAEAPFARATGPIPAADFVLPTPIVPVVLQLNFSGEAAPPDADVLIRDDNGQPIARVAVSRHDIDAARGGWRKRTLAVELVIAAAMLLLLTAPLLDWRRVSRSVTRHLVLTAGIVTLLFAARALSWMAVRLWGVGVDALVSPEVAGPFLVLLASPLDFLLTALTIAALVALATSSFEQWRQSRRLRRRVIPDSGASETLTFLALQIVSGAAVGAMLVGYEHFLRTQLSSAPIDILHFSLHPFEAARLSVAMGLVVLHAALLGAAVLLFRIAIARWIVAADRRWIRAAVPALWTASAALAIVNRTQGWEDSPIVPATLVVLVAIAAAWRLRRYRAALEHASQAARLTAFLIALILPSIVFYPSLVDAAGRARRQLVETRYAPEVVNQRRNLQLQLDEVMRQVDALPDLADLIDAGDPAPASPLPYETAFRVWERTLLERQRLTSSVELHDAAGSLVSRFALKLPHYGEPQVYYEGTCQWEIWGEVSPFFAEQRRLLHAGKGICADTPQGPRLVGSVAIHLMLDYSNLSFISAQSPYVALLRSQEAEPSEPGPRESLDFVAYGWSRRPLYVSGRQSWPLSEEIFARIFASRDPFWARVTVGDVGHEVYFLNDRFGIYALGFPTASSFEHLNSLAELVVLSATTFLLLLAAGLVYGRIAARTPTSGRALLREVRASFYRKLFIGFVAAAVMPVLALALVTRAYIATLLVTDLEMEAARTAASASRVVEDVGFLEISGTTVPEVVDDDIVVWLSRVIAQDVNIFDGAGVVASSERSLFAYGLLPRSTQGDVYRAIVLEGRPSFVARETVGTTEYLVAAAPVRVQNRRAILTVPLTLRQQQIEAQIDALDRRVLLAAVLFIALGAIIGYSLAERIADPVNRLMRATGRIARGELDVRVLATSSDEFRRLVEAFNRMAADLQRQRAELERTNRLAAWADMARQVAHDIKNPLTPIQLNAEHLRRVHQDRGSPLGRTLDECVNNILMQVRLLRQIASEFSSFASSPTARPVPSALHELIREVLQPYQVGLEHRVRIEQHVAESLPLVMVDKNILARALTNVIENALHAMPAGGTLRVQARAVDGTRVELTLSDTGVGMDRAALDRIFEPYFSTRATGTGLGLTIAKRNVELNGGTIAVESVRGQGTTVRMILPTAQAAA
jgi:signal transduction histidine kinase